MEHFSDDSRMRFPVDWRWPLELCHRIIQQNHKHSCMFLYVYVFYVCTTFHCILNSKHAVEDVLGSTHLDEPKTINSFSFQKFFIIINAYEYNVNGPYQLYAPSWVP